MSCPGISVIEVASQSSSSADTVVNRDDCIRIVVAVGYHDTRDLEIRNETGQYWALDKAIKFYKAFFFLPKTARELIDIRTLLYLDCAGLCRR